ncbi:unnamed protein product [Penicillium nalgiovense]|nr:unnamed protein product [Penicillium nalgiovense]
MADALPDDPKLTKTRVLVFFSLATLSLMSALDGTSISVALPIISHELHGSAIETFWTGTSFLLASTVFQPNFAAFSNIFGRKVLIMTALTFFLVGALIACLAKDFTSLIIGRSFQGVGGGGINAMTEIIITDIIPLRLRGQYFGILSAMWAVGSVTGPILGGGFAQSVNWRWIFYINFPFIGIGGILRGRLYGNCPLCREYILLPDSINLGGVLYSWSSWHTLVPLIVGIVGLIAFAVYEAKGTANPIIPVTVFQNRSIIISYVTDILHGMILWCILYYLPLYYEAVKGYTPIISGVALFPITFTTAPSSVVVGFLITRFGSYRWAIWLGWATSTLGLGIMCLMDIDTSVPAWVFLNLVGGLGLGILFPALAFAVQASVDSEHLAIAVALFSFLKSLGQAIGVAIGGVVFQNQMLKNLQQYPALEPRAVEYSQDASGLVQVIRDMSDGQDKSDLKKAYADSLRIVWAICCGLCGLAMLLSFGTESYDVDRALDTTQGLRTEKADDSDETDQPKEIEERGKSTLIS